MDQTRMEKTVDLIWDLMHRVRHRAHPARKGALTIQQFVLLKSLQRYGEKRVGEVARLLGLTQSSVSIAIKRLEKDGLVARERDQADQRRVGLALTEAGHKVIREWKEKRNQATECFLRRLDDAERNQLHLLLGKMLGDDRPEEEEET